MFLPLDSRPSCRKRPRPPPDAEATIPPPDRLSSLHDSILANILSFLPTIQALRTCVLSKRWRAISASLPTLDFDLSELGNGNFVERVLGHRDGADVRRFRLVSPKSHHKDSGRISNWVLYATTHRVRQLKIEVSCTGRGFMELGSDAINGIFHCKSLETLELTSLLLDPLVLSNSIHFSKLRVLRLSHILGSSEDLVGKLISNCPMLEDLSLVGDLGVLSICAPNLRKLQLSSFRTSEIRIYCPRLRLFTLWTSEIKYFEGDMPCLVKAFISVVNKNPGSDSFVGQILQSIENVSFLCFTVFNSGLCTRHFAEKQSKRLPTLQNLKRLDTRASFHSDHIEALICLLELTPSLESLTVRHQPECRCDNKGSWTSRKLPSKFLDDLKVIYISNYCKAELDNQNEFLKFLSVNVRSWDGVSKQILMP